MKAIYLLQNKPTLNAVYAPSLRAELNSRYGEMPTYTKEELAANVENLRDTELSFSTWTMPTHSED